jgi:hypothetical protein
MLPPQPLTILPPPSHVQIYVAEWIPFGANQIVSLNERLGSLDRCQGGLFTSMVDKNPTDTQFKVDAGLTQVPARRVERQFQFVI